MSTSGYTTTFFDSLLDRFADVSEKIMLKNIPKHTDIEDFFLQKQRMGVHKIINEGILKIELLFL